MEKDFYCIELTLQLLEYNSCLTKRDCIVGDSINTEYRIYRIISGNIINIHLGIIKYSVGETVNIQWGYY